MVLKTAVEMCFPSMELLFWILDTSYLHDLKITYIQVCPVMDNQSSPKFSVFFEQHSLCFHLLIPSYVSVFSWVFSSEVQSMCLRKWLRSQQIASSACKKCMIYTQTIRNHCISFQYGCPTHQYLHQIFLLSSFELIYAWGQNHRRLFSESWMTGVIMNFNYENN